MLDRYFGLTEHNTNLRTEFWAGLTTFLTMAYIIFVQPAVLSGSMFGMSTGMDFGAVTVATCVAAALATAIMGLYARYPIAQAPGMGENFFFVFSVLPAAGAAFAAQIKAGNTTAWQIGLGTVFIAGVLFLALSLLGVREKMLEAISPSMRNGIAIGIGLFIAFIGLQNAGLIVKDPGTAVKLNRHLFSPDLIVFFLGLLTTAALYVRGWRGAIVWGIIAATLLAVGIKAALPHLPEAISKAKPVVESKLATQFSLADRVISPPPSISPTLFKMDLANAFSLAMLPFILIFLFMDLFDTLGTLIGVGEQAGLVRHNKLPRAGKALVSDAVGTVAGAALGTSTVTSFIESAAGVERGGRTGLTAVTTALFFLLALFFYPVIKMVGNYPPVTAPALVVVGSMMIRNVVKIDWSDYSESMPAFLIMIGIPLTYSIADGLALGFIAYPLIKLASGRAREVKWLMYVTALTLFAYFIIRMTVE